MKRHKELFDPIIRTATMKKEDFLKYIDICDRQPAITPTRPSLVREIHDIFYESHPDVERSHLDNVWAFIHEKLEKNEGLAQFVLDYNGAKSSYFFPWLIQVFTSPSAALEMAYNAGADLTGTWTKKVPEDDEINFFVRNVPTFVYNRERQLFVADLATTVRESNPGKTKIIDFGAGRLAWTRWHGFKFEPERQSILAFDMDPTIQPEELYDVPLEELSVEYHKNNFMAELYNPKCKNANLVILGGVASYYPVDVFTEKVAKPVHGLLAEGGSFFFDFQLLCPQYTWSVKLFDWPEIKLSESPWQAIETAENIRRGLWHRGMRFEAEYKLDTCNDMPSSVMMVFTKI